MSKIYNVRKAFHKIFEKLKNHEVSVVFFNNDFKVITTLKDSSFSVDHSILLNTIQNIRCSSITDFSKIIDGINVVNSFNSSLPIVSTIISDGYHTMDDDSDITLEEITSKLEKKFDFSIGLGCDYDKDLLTKLSKEFHCEQTSSMFNFLSQYFVETNDNYIIIEPDHFIVSSNEYKVVNCIDGEDYNESVKTIEKEEHYECFCIQNKINNVLDISDKKHFIFVIDNSGSMDDTFHSRVLENFYEDTNFYITKIKERKKVIFYEPNTKIIVGKTKLMNIENIPINETEEILYTCFVMNELEKNKERRLEILYKLYNQKYKNNNIKKYVQKNYNSLLSSSEKKLNVLLHNEISNEQDVNTNTQIKNGDNITECGICYSDTRSIVFSCHHILSCLDCSVKLMDQFKPKCPICRQEIIWLRKFKFKENVSVCIQCQENIVGMYQDCCNTLLYCSKCFDTHYNSCSECKQTRGRSFSVHLV